MIIWIFEVKNKRHLHKLIFESSMEIQSVIRGTQKEKEKNDTLWQDIICVSFIWYLYDVTMLI